jgi:hypothetical protein
VSMMRGISSFVNDRMIRYIMEDLRNTMLARGKLT